MAMEQEIPPAPPKPRTIVIIFLIGFTDLLGVSMIVPLLPKLLFNMFHSRSLAGIIGSVYGGLQIFSSSTMGKMSDTYGRKNILLLSYLVSAASYFLLSLSWNGGLLVLSRTISGIFKHGLSISKAYIADVTTVQERPSYLGYYNAVTSSGFIIGPFLAGYLTDYDPSLRLTILTGAIIFSLNFVFTLLFLPASRKDLELKNEPTAKSTGPSLQESIAKYLSWNRLREGFKLFHWENLTEVILIQFLASFAMLIFRTNLPVFLEENFVLSGSRYGQMMSFSALASTVFSATCGIVSKFYQNNNSRQLVHFMVLLSVSLTAFTFSSHLSYVLILLATVSLSTSNLRICMLNLILLQGREDEKGAIVGFTTTLTSIARMLTPTMVGVLQEFGSRAAGLASVSLALLALLGSIRFSLTTGRKEVS